ncbi:MULTISPECIES: stage II sporulation protein SB [Bacillus cereus group]|uniref:Stage III sporulation protein AA n=1 Tax=Bacillus cytotoxicus TaxID=580165 RepID=A0AAX2CGL8_9BACI|nr:MULTISPECIES: stage II sporulation protein SB [Bacillus cereus group]AWC28703.1 stage III sporulation protein AA [Bacillus cytotoxicus]AWC39915.1 stage III sporulation protein AA [Bacillus cytotoxicus]AWC47846.1 stage III sporulation protein AA [Bacillus cytotoxicus]AWC52770.1 stage III sporulation protein AA [Bacillus cytotoxicus]AWC56902.1 stage III sporulation protein AA [Bacillus cytotoxicus]
MKETKQNNLSFFKEQKEAPNIDFSLVKGALTENINRLEKLMYREPSKYIHGKKLKENV